MKNLIFLLLIIVTFSTVKIHAQESGIYIPREYKRALTKNTRNESGAPGAAFFQNCADYSIDASFDPNSRILKGKETITYTHNGPDSLRSIVFNIDHDIFKAGTSRVYDVDKDDLTYGVDISNVKINGEEIVLLPPLWNRDGTETYVRLKKPMSPESQIVIELEWSLFHPLKTQIRSGTYDSLSFFIAYWFPRVAVYDDIFGWDYTQHLGSGEFYNDFGNFDISMTLPGNYLMWATGELQNAKELFQEQTISRLKNASESIETVNIASASEMKENKVLKPGKSKKWHFKAEKVTDFAFGISSVYQWDAVSVKLDNGKKVTVNAAYPENAPNFNEVASIGAKTIKKMSEGITGFPYPYPSMTVFCGHGGMEYPMIVNDGADDTKPFTVFVTAHEVSHTWFPFVAGFNETRYGWMDEGLITVLPKEIEISYFPESNPHKNYMRSYSNWAGREEDINMTVSSNSIANTSAYRMNVYARAAAAFYHLGDAMGDLNFKKTLNIFLNEWAYKHPSPYDFINTCSRVSGEDLGWYFKPWFFENGYPDLAIENVREESDKTTVTISRKGIMPVPINLKYTFSDGSSEENNVSVQTWKDGKNKLELTVSGKKKLVSIELGSENIPDSFPEDNSWKAE